jgi:AraC family transcriptional regulator
MNAAAKPGNLRKTLIDSDLLLAEELLARPELPPSGHTRTRQLAITFAGAFEFQVGRVVTWVDCSRILFAEADLPFVDHHVVPATGHRSIIFTPRREAIDEICVDADDYFARRVQACSLRTQMLVQLLRRTPNQLAAQEIAWEIMTESVIEKIRPAAVDPRCVRRAKTMLHDHVEGRLTLTEIASEVGVTPIHLTQTFKRSEGMPLYRYEMALRLARALDGLPEREDISDLAFELGFSSHSHFTAAFRSGLGITPSVYRARSNGRSEAHPGNSPVASTHLSTSF